MKKLTSAVDSVIMPTVYYTVSQLVVICCIITISRLFSLPSDQLTSQSKGCCCFQFSDQDSPADLK